VPLTRQPHPFGCFTGLPGKKALAEKSPAKHPVGAAPGNRGHGDGLLIHVGRIGYSWASSIAGGRAHRLGFLPNWISSQGSDYPAYGFQLRCLQEEGEEGEDGKHGRRIGPPGKKRVTASGKELRALPSSSPRPGWRRLAHSKRSAVSLRAALLPNSQPPKNDHWPRALAIHSILRLAK
jgi:hypothetical protein